MCDTLEREMGQDLKNSQQGTENGKKRESKINLSLLYLNLNLDNNFRLFFSFSEPETTAVTQMTRGKKIYLAAKELRDTEETFLNVLTMLDVDFREFITEKNPNDIIIPQASFEEIFSNMNMLRNLSEANLKEFRECIKNWQEPDKTKIAHVLVKQGYFLQMFGQYTNDYTKNHQLFLELLEKFPKFKEAVLEFQSRDCCQNLPITGFFLKPCQRLAQYKLLMENYKKKLFPVSIDYQDACKALGIISI